MTEIIYNSGYNDPKAFRKVFKKSVGMTPTQYREKFQVRYNYFKVSLISPQSNILSP